MKIKTIIYLCVALVILSIVSGSGIGPARRTFSIGPGEMEESFFYVTPDKFPSTIFLTPDGETSGFVALESYNVTIYEPMTKVKYYIRLPKTAKPGLYTGGISIEFSSGEPGLSNIQAKVIVIHQLWLNATLKEEDNAIGRSAVRILPSLSTQNVPVTLGILLLTLSVIILAMFMRTKIKPAISEEKRIELRKYIIEARLSGFTPDLVKQKLLDSGWPKKAVNAELKRLFK